MGKSIRISSRRHMVLAGKRIQVSQANRLRAVGRGSARHRRDQQISWIWGKKEPSESQTLEEGQVSKGLDSWGGPKQAGTGEESHHLSLLIFPSLPIVQTQSEATRPASESRSWRGMVGMERPMANGI